MGAGQGKQTGNYSSIRSGGEESNTREKVLKKIRQALVSRGDSSYLKADLDSEIFHVPSEAPEIVFAEKFADLNGHFIFCVDEEELSENLSGLFKEKKWKSAFCKEEEIFYFLSRSGISAIKEFPNENAEPLVAASLCECVVANTGSFFVSAKQMTGRNFFVNNDVHIVIAFTSQVISSVRNGFDFIKTKYEGRLPSQLTLISGPSKTADIEQSLVFGAHGPKELYFFLVEG